MPTQVDTDGVAEPETTADKPATRRRRTPLTPPALPPLTVTDRGLLATKLAVIAVLEKQLAAVKADAKAIIGKQMRTGETVIPCLDPDDDDPVEHGTSLGTVSKAKGAKRWVIEDDEKFTAWTEEHFPTEVETVVRVRDSFKARVREGCKGDAGFPMPSTGEVVIPAGMKFTAGDPQVRVNTSDEAEAIVLAALASGGAAAFLLDGVPALPAGSDA
jgi:hypothetical protein